MYPPIERNSRKQQLAFTVWCCKHDIIYFNFMQSWKNRIIILFQRIMKKQPFNCTMQTKSSAIIVRAAESVETSWNKNLFSAVTAEWAVNWAFGFTCPSGWRFGKVKPEKMYLCSKWKSNREEEKKVNEWVSRVKASREEAAAGKDQNHLLQSEPNKLNI